MKTAFLFLLATFSFLVQRADCFCTYKGGKICEGAVTKEKKTLLQVCENGGLKYKKIEKVKPGYPLAGKDCEWYGDVICDGAIVQDLNRWWFQSKCSNKRLSVVGRSWLEVVKDPRYKKKL
eukprot:GFUD01088046.1.p2 GENE.GFUD01088046.1~~GFUD01088046.1.p2  ORF type:complete len:121 (+),score=30.87 GFUD01088046.1:138-500(+)